MSDKKTGPWRITASCHIHQDRWISVRADDCITPDGVIVAPYYVLEYPDWVHVIAITPDQKIVLIDQYRHAIGKVSLEIPAGNIDPTDAGPIEAAARELLEETGYAADEYRLVTKLSPNPATHTNVIHVVLALNAQRLSDQLLDPSETIEASLMSCRDLLAGILLGDMIQGLQVSSVLLALENAGLITINPNTSAV